MKYQAKYRTELLILFVVGVVLLLILQEFDVYEDVHVFLEKYEDYELDEWLLLMPVLLVLTVIFAVCRLVEVNRKEREQRMHNIRLREAYDKIKDLTTAREQFMGVVFHELMNPLNGLLGAIKLVEMSDSYEEVQENTQLVKKAGRNIKVFSEDIMEVSKILLANQDGEHGIFNPAKVIQEAVFPSTVMAERAGVNFVFDFDPGLPQSLVGNKKAIRHIMGNLVSNAVKHAGKGGIKISCFFQDKGHPELFISVADTGPGIADELVKRIFEPYSQGESMAKGGMGLGLFITKKLVDHLQGTISIKPNQPHGSIFEVVLPIGIDHDQSRDDKA